MNDDEEIAAGLAGLSEGSDEEPEPKRAPEPPRTPNAPPKRGPGRPPKDRSTGAGEAPSASPSGVNAPWRSTMATDLANEIAERLHDYPQVGQVYDLDCKVFPQDGSGERLLGSIPFGDLIRNDVPPGQVLHTLVTDRIHMHYLGAKGGPVDYLITFQWRRSGKWYAKGKLPLGSHEEIVALRRGMAGGVGGAYSPPAYAAPVPSYVAPYSPSPQPAPGYGAPAPGSQGNEDIRRELAAMQGSLAEAINFVREIRQQGFAGIPPQQSPAPAPASAQQPGSLPTSSGLAGITEESVVRLVAATLKALGVPMGPAATPAQTQAAPGSSQNAPLGQVPSPPRPADPMDEVTTEIRGMLTGVLREGVGMVMRNIREGVKQGFQPPAGVGAAVAEEPPEVAQAEPAPEPPFYAHDVGSKWGDGRPVMFPQGSDGEIDWRAVPFANPIIAEKGMDVVASVGKSLGDAAKVLAERLKVPDSSAAAAHVVSKIPRGAVDGTPRPGASVEGVGAPPVSPNRAAASPAAAPPHPHANGAPEPSAHVHQDPPPEPATRKPGGGFPSL